MTEFVVRVLVPLVNAGLTALNAALFVLHGHAISAGAAVFCGLMFAWSVVTAARWPS